MAQKFKAKTLLSNSGVFNNQVIAPNLVYNTGNQNISGDKTFEDNVNISGDLTLNGGLYINDITDLSLEGANIYADNIIYNTGNQNISGIKNFYNRPFLSGTGFLLSGEIVSFPPASGNLIDTLSGNLISTGSRVDTLSGRVVFITGNQNISGDKTFKNNVNISGDLNASSLNTSGTVNLTGEANKIGKGDNIFVDGDFVYIRRYDGNTILSTEEALISDYNAFGSLNFNDRALIATNGYSLDWGNRSLINSGGYEVLNWTGSIKTTTGIDVNNIDTLTLSGVDIRIQNSTSGVDFGNGKIYNAAPDIIYVSNHFNITGNQNSRMILASSSSIITGTIVSGNPTGFNISIVQCGLGQIKITGSGNGIGIASAGNRTKTNTQFSAISLIHTGNNSYILLGDSAS